MECRFFKSQSTKHIAFILLNFFENISVEKKIKTFPAKRILHHGSESFGEVIFVQNTKTLTSVGTSPLLTQFDPVRSFLILKVKILKESRL